MGLLRMVLLRPRFEIWKGKERGKLAVVRSRLGFETDFFKAFLFFN